MIDNSQVNWIATDSGAEAFYSKLFEKFSSQVSDEMKEQLEGVAAYLTEAAF